MNLPWLDEATVSAYLARLGNPEVSLDLDGLSRLLRAHLCALPFHNLGRPRERSGAVEAMVEDTIAGWGGNCQALMLPFVTLLRALGFDAWPGAADAREPGDLVVGIVRLREGRFLVDAGSGAPCLQPLPLDGEPMGFTAYGQCFRFEQTLRERYQLSRILPDGRFEGLYCLTPVPLQRAPPLITGRPLSPEEVRAVRMTGRTLAVLQQGRYQRFVAGLEGTRPVEGWTALRTLLRTSFGVPEELLHQALPALEEQPPSMSERAGRSLRPLRFILSMASTGRADSVEGLLGSVSDLLERTRRPVDSVGVLLLDNARPGLDGGALDGALHRAAHRGLRVARVDARDMLWQLIPFQRLGLLPAPLSLPLSIGASRTLQTALLSGHLRQGNLGLPHPGDGGGPVLVWMLDDDLAFRRLVDGPGGLEVEPGDDLLDRAERLWATQPHVSVVLGTFTGDPPIPGYATFRVQVHDLVGNLQVMADGRPDLPWNPGEAPRALPDYYYDHARGSTAHLEVVFPWKCAPACRVRDAFRLLCTAFAQVPHGRQVTRPLTYAASGALSPSRHRGGNALFLDLDALRVAPYPVMRGPDGIDTRRADTLWAHLSAREPLFHMVRADLDLLHGRRVGDGSSPLAEQQPEGTALRRFVEAQERGVVLARLLERGPPMEPADAEREMAARRGVLARGREGLHEEVASARKVLLRPEAWWWRDEADSACARACLASVEHVARLGDAVDALDEPWLAERLAEFARHVVSTLPDWKAVWD